jgi:hypothetical protein
MTRATLLLLPLALAACPAGPVSEPTPVAGPTECERMADHLVGAMLPKDSGKPSDGETAVVDKLTRMLIRECVDMKWSVDAQKCFATINEMTEADKCAPLLTTQQRDSADAAIDKVFPKKPAPSAPAAPGSATDALP